MKITLLCSEPNHPVNEYLVRWIAANGNKHDVLLVRSRAELVGGQILFLISCSEVISFTDRLLFDVTLVLHASDLPRGRGWSPHIWEIIGGADQITVCLLEAEDAVDTGRIWHQITLPIPKHALWMEINDALFSAEVKLIEIAIKNFESIVSKPQRSDIEATYFAKRKPTDSQVDPYRSIAAQFDLIRVCDPERFPAYFELHGYKYKLTLEKISGIKADDQNR
jgi:methionyl-tRNA formyltransferase